MRSQPTQPAGSSADPSGRMAIDLTECDREPIHIPGAIQPHGYLFALAGGDPRLVSMSANVEALLGRPVADLADTSLVPHLCGDSAARLDAAFASADPATVNPIRIDARTAAGERAFNGILHRSGELTILELETRDPAQQTSEFFRSVRSAIRRLQIAGDLANACNIAAGEIRRITGFDRVKVYRFSQDWSGQVIAESRDDNVPSLLDFHFPSSDIPAQSRALYTTNKVRIIPDIGYTPTPLVPDYNPIVGGPIDLSFAVLRSVSPTHCEYMINMGMHGAMSISIVRDGRLWGMVSCHNVRPRFVSYEIRQACELIVQVLTWQIGVLEEAEIVRHSVRVRAIQNRLLHELGDDQGLPDGLPKVGDEMLALMNASGFALCGFDGAVTFGRTPPRDEIMALSTWFSRREPRAIFQTDQLSTSYPPAVDYSDCAAGVLAVPLGRASSMLMLWFRPEVAQTVTWGGNPHKPVQIGPRGQRLQTRASFDAWREEVRGKSLPWRSHEIAAAEEIRDLVVDVILGRAEALENANRDLSRSNDELESFAYVAAHDLKEPLRHIEAFAGLLNDLLLPDARARLSTMVNGIEASSRRLRALINDLAEYSRVGRQARPLQPASLNDILADVLSDLKPTIEDARAEIVAGDLPVVPCDRSQIRQLMQNLISNALKYRSSDRIPQIRIRASLEPAMAPPENDAGVVEVSIEDNGIGFDEKYKEQIFEPFQRLHGQNEYEGTGIGLAICRKIVHRHAGTISATSSAGRGSVFTFTLPLQRPGHAEN
ncbi:ATPase [Rhodopseudomonas sp. AAP120]|uniref:ATP-binding protein n=1 Tax=Rhodopseudomonas sp. AAP120 TaxID=1523430 RepID=UPI0006B88F5F|nr:ATP-binding protein [Rhodopseudomonas sp. AAP120]KPF95068.1 ATPase [Rhodopseudomonas sp. AAP120]